MNQPLLSEDDYLQIDTATVLLQNSYLVQYAKNERNEFQLNCNKFEIF